LRQCTPGRIGATRGVEVIDRVLAGVKPADNMALLEDLCHTMKFGSLCALGGFAPYPVMSAVILGKISRRGYAAAE
jgi:formate dehydrogenase iron-sulfur subunit